MSLSLSRVLSTDMPAAPPSVKYYSCDLSSATSISDAVDGVRADFGHPTVLINNAGICYGEPVLSASAEHVRKTFEINVFAHHALATHLVPSMVAANHGTVVTVASQAAWIAAPRMADYAASKAAALAMHEALAAELATLYNAPKVRAIAVCPNATKTPLFEGFQMYNNMFLYKLEPDDGRGGGQGRAQGAERHGYAAGYWVVHVCGREGRALVVSGWIEEEVQGRLVGVDGADRGAKRGRRERWKARIGAW